MSPRLGLRMGLATQTPLLRLLDDPTARRPLVAAHPNAAAETRSIAYAQAGAAGASPSPPETPAVEDSVEQAALLSDHHINPGGVSRMVLQSVRAWRRAGLVQDAHWFSLQPNGPRRMWLEDAGIHLHHLRLPPAELGAYARTKERLWADIHGLGPGSQGAGGARFLMEDFRFYARYNGLASDAILGQVGDIDVAYVHDFQLLQVGAIAGFALPCVLRWHVPFEPRRMPGSTRTFLIRMLEAYDAIIVSTRRELEGLANAGFHGKVRQIYPHSDPGDWKAPTRAAYQQAEDALQIPAEAQVILIVARMDPMKRQDLAIEALARLRLSHPRAHLLLVGNGSFSASRTGGLHLSKAQEWHSHLTNLALQLGISDRVHFAGWIPDAHVAYAYARAEVLVLPSDIEGFGLTPFEAWGHAKPCIVSNGCGCAEVVQDGVNGLVFAAGDSEALAQAIARILDDPEGARRIGEAGHVSLQSHTPEAAARMEAECIGEAVARYRRRA